MTSILVVEDSHLVAENLRGELCSLGYSCRVAHDVETAKTLISQEPPGLVLMDIGLAREDEGLLFAEEVYVCDHLPVVLLTGQTDAAVIARASKVGAYGYLVKPFAAAALRATIEVALLKHAEVQRFVDTQRWSLAALNGIDVAVIVVSPSGELRAMNRAAETLTGYAMGAHVLEMPPWLPELAKISEEPVTLSLSHRSGRELVLRGRQVKPRAGSTDRIVVLTDALRQV